MDINYFRKINNLTGTTSVTEANLNSAKWKIRHDFLQSPLLEQVQINGVQQSLIVQNDSLDKQTKKINTLPDESFSCGDVIDWNSITWLVIEFDPSEKFYSKGTLKRCVGQLKWINSSGTTLSYPFTFKTDTATNFGVTVDKVMTLGNERRILIAPLNDDTKTIGKDKRFIFDGRAWIVTAVDRISVDGLVILTVDENLISNEKDNLEFEIADYYVSTSPPSPSTDTNSITITGSDECRVGQTEEYISNNSVNWTLLSEDLMSATELATIVVSDATKCMILANNQKKYGYLFLVATLTSDTSQTILKKIKIRSLL